MSEVVLTLNAGSSSLKFALFRVGGPPASEPSAPDGPTPDDAESDDPAPVLRGQVERIGTAPRLLARDAAGAALPGRDWAGERDAGGSLGHEALLGDVFGWIEARLGGAVLAAAGHRIVHGGERFADPVRLDEGVLAALDRLRPLAPLHQPRNLALVRAVARLRPGLVQVGCFDTAFHRTMPALAARFALPRELTEAGIRRYGFHGLSYEHVARRLRALAPGVARGRVIAAHLGNGASLCAMRDGRSVDTTMGFSALDGLVMGTRCGALDPGVVLHLLRERGMSAEEVEHLLYHRSGLLGVSGLSGDMRVLLASDDPRAREAVELFAFRAAREAGALAAGLGGLDGLVFTAGIGENAAPVRAAICERLSWLGVRLDPAANARGGGRVSARESRVEVWVVPTDEEAMIVRHTREVLGRAA